MILTVVEEGIDIGGQQLSIFGDYIGGNRKTRAIKQEFNK